MPTQEFEIGDAELLSETPRQLTLGGRRFFLTQFDEKPQLLSAICPHMSGLVADDGEVFRCGLHDWTFDRITGACLNAPHQQLAATPVSIRGGKLYAEIEHVGAGTVARRTATKSRAPLSVTLHAHACLEFSLSSYVLLSDPWLDGPAMMGAWTHYPPNDVNWDALHPSAIFITHEHSDHFHIPTLRRFSRQTPIYVPDFANRRMVNRLHDLGFDSVHPLRFGEPLNAAPGVTLTCFEPSSLWNDSIWLLELRGTKFLYLGDAGLNPRIAELIGPVDIVASGFSPGASGYPLTWSHLDDDAKQQIMQRSKEGLIENLKQAVTLYGASHVLPFASHFQLGYPAHRLFNGMIKKNTVMDVVEAFRGTHTTVIDLLPGDQWNRQDGVVPRLENRNSHYEPNTIARYLDDSFDLGVFLDHHPHSRSVEPKEVDAYFASLNDSTEIACCEDLTFSISATDGYLGDPQFTRAFRVTDCRLEALVGSDIATTHVKITLPVSVLADLVLDGESWDEALIGYWCQNDRSPDVFHSGFWRLLQAPSLRRSAKSVVGTAERNAPARTESLSVAEIQERGGSEADRLLRRYGVYCFGCHHATSDTLSIAASCHGVDRAQLKRLTSELGKVLR